MNNSIFSKVIATIDRVMGIPELRIPEELIGTDLIGTLDTAILEAIAEDMERDDAAVMPNPFEEEVLTLQATVHQKTRQLHNAWENGRKQRKEIEDLKAANGLHESSIHQKTTRIDTLAEEQKELDRQLHNAWENGRKQRKEIEDLKAANGLHESSIESLRYIVGVAEARGDKIKNLESQIKTLQDNSARRTQTLFDRNDRISELTDELAAANHKIHEQKDEIAELKDDVKKFSGMAVEYHAQKFSLETAIEELAQDLIDNKLPEEKLQARQVVSAIQHLPIDAVAVQFREETPHDLNDRISELTARVADCEQTIQSESTDMMALQQAIEELIEATKGQFEPNENISSGHMVAALQDLATDAHIIRMSQF